MRAAWVGSLVFFLLVVVAFRSAPGGSVFGLNFLGERLEAGDPRALALGGEFQVVADSTAVLSPNPALPALCSKVTIGGVQVVCVYWDKSRDGKEKNLSVKYPVFAAAFPLRRGLVLSLGYRARYDPQASFTIPGADASGISYREEFSKNGGLYAVPISLSVRIASGFTFGLAYNVEGGSIEDSWQVSFDQRGMAPGGGKRKLTLRGESYSLGFLLRPGAGLTLAGYFQTRVRYDLSGAESYTQSALDSSFSGTSILPAQVNLALVWRPAGDWSFHLGGSRRDFSNATGWALAKSWRSKEERYAFGFSHRFASGTPLRVSFTFGRWPYQYPRGSSIEEYALAVGTSLSIAEGMGRIDVSLQGGQTGSIDSNRIEERFARIVIGVSGGEVWKRKRVKR